MSTYKEVKRVTTHVLRAMKADNVKISALISGGGKYKTIKGGGSKKRKAKQRSFHSARKYDSLGADFTKSRKSLSMKSKNHSKSRKKQHIKKPSNSKSSRRNSASVSSSIKPKNSVKSKPKRKLYSQSMREHVDC
jgi:hypothetical protein